MVGFGTEGKLLIPGWTLKAEFLYMDLGTLDATASSVTGTTTVPLVISASATGGPVSAHTHFTDGIMRVGLNYQFH